MEVKILDSIIHGDLKPWKINTTDTRRFTELVKAANAASPKTNAVLLSQLTALFADYPTLQKILKEETPNNSTEIVNHFFKIDLPKFNDPVTQFYQTAITKEALRFFNAYLQQTVNWTEPVDIRYQVGKTLTSIRVLANQTATELQERGFASVPDTQSDFIHFTLYTLKQTLTALFFAVQEVFKTQLADTTTEDFFYINYLNEAYPEVSPLAPDTAYFEFHFRSIQTAEEFNKVAALHLLKQIQQHQPEQHQRLQAAFENLVFLQSQKTDTANQTIEQLTEPGTIKNQFAEAKTTLLKPVNKLQLGQQRLEVVNNLLDELDYIQSTTTNKLSLPQLLYKYLLEQKEIYTQRFTEKFPIIIEDETQAAQQKDEAPKFTFGFNGDKTKFKTVLSQLSLTIDLLNEEKNSVDELLEVFTTKDLQPNSTKIYINCETAQFRYIIDCITLKFSSLKLKAIEKSGVFFSKNGTLITSQNLSAGKVENPKEKDKIDNIMKHLQ